MANQNTCTYIVENWKNEFVNHDWYGDEEPTLVYVVYYEHAKAYLLKRVTIASRCYHPKRHTIIS